MGPLAIRPAGRLLFPAAAAALVALLFGAPDAQARSGGVASSLFAGEPDGCNSCHGGGVAPTVALSASSLTPMTGQQITLSFEVTSNSASQIAAGFNLRSSQAGTFAVGGPDSGSTRTIADNDTEATHMMPKDGVGSPAKTTFSVLWTPGPGVSGAVTFTAWGNSVNRANGNQGDRAATTSIVVTYCTAATYYRDMDGDSFGNHNQPSVSCSMPSGYVANDTDCDDGSAAIHPGAAEVCNGVDDNCNGMTDEGGAAPGTFYRDMDADGFGNPTQTSVSCTMPGGHVTNNTDCNDNDVNIHPGGAEVCNGADDNCNGTTDEGGAAPGTFYRDMDADGFGNPAQTSVSCTMPGGHVANNTDCNDNDATIHPGATEICNGADDNCNDARDDGLPTTTFYKDNDGDMHGAATSGTKDACSLALAGSGYVESHDDCDDADGNAHPGAPEVCDNGKDDNCNGTIDTDAPAISTFYRDMDGDGSGSTASGMVMACAPPSGYVASNTDCNDNDAAIRPGATEVCNGKDDDCEGGTDEDLPPLTCGAPTCPTTVPSCVGGVPQTCTPVCPPDASPEPPPAPDASPEPPPAPDASPEPPPTPDAGSPDTTPPSPSPDAAAPPDTTPPAPKPDADPPDRSGMTASPDGAVVTPDGGAPKPDTAPRLDGSASKRDASLDGLATGTGGGGCDCRIEGKATPSGVPLAAAATLLLTLLRRRRKNRL